MSSFYNAPIGEKMRGMNGVFSIARGTVKENDMLAIILDLLALAKVFVAPLLFVVSSGMAYSAYRASA